MSITRTPLIGDPTTPRWSRHSLTRAAGLVLGLLGCTVSWGVELEWQPQFSHDVESSDSDSTISVVTTGSDPYLVWRLPRPAEPKERILEFEYFSVDGIESVSGYLGPPITEESHFELPDLTPAEGWQTYHVDLVEATGGPLNRSTYLLRIDLGTRANSRILIRRPQLRERTPVESDRAEQAAQLRREKELADQSIGDYLNNTFAWAINDVQVKSDQIVIEGRAKVDHDHTGLIQLIEFPPQNTSNTSGVDSGQRFGATEGHFRLQLPRYWEGRDRLHSAWRLKNVDHDGLGQWLSARHFATDIALRSPDVPSTRATPRSQKGLSAVSRRGPLEELPELGIHAITINLVLDRFLTDRAGGNREPIPVAGPAIYFNPDPFNHYDDLIEFARRHQIVVSAIVLIQRAKRPEHRSVLVHPETDAGVYAMPDLSSERGTRIYAFLLDRIAERYRDTERSPGGITNWIAHNEIDFHSVWTNMGPQPRRVLTETYYRSMRMIDAAARQHNPHARVFASLTHHWVVPDDGKWRRLSPKDTIRSLQRYSELEGDFPWGVAYHPYPESLFAETAWNDVQPQMNLETPLITIQNIEVLGQFLAQTSMRDPRGNTRPVLLSEQGFHSRSYQPEDQNRQASSLWYAMRKIQTMPWIESFFYHRWIDHPDEGGLLLGLRTLPDEQHRYGRRKLSWDVYRAIGTDDERDLVKELRLRVPPSLP